MVEEVHEDEVVVEPQVEEAGPEEEVLVNEAGDTVVTEQTRDDVIEPEEEEDVVPASSIVRTEQTEHEPGEAGVPDPNADPQPKEVIDNGDGTITFVYEEDKEEDFKAVDAPEPNDVGTPAVNDNDVNT